MTGLIAIALALAGGAGPAPEPPPAAPRMPTSRWVVDFAATQCLATRNYGSETEPLTLALKPSVVGNVIQIAIVLPARKTMLGEPEEKAVTVRIDDRPPTAARLLAVSAKRGELRSLWINL